MNGYTAFPLKSVSWFLQLLGHGYSNKGATTLSCLWALADYERLLRAINLLQCKIL